MNLSRLTASALCTGLIGLGANSIFGQSYPNKPIRIVTGETGGGSDIVARLIAKGISGPLGQSVVVENRPAGNIPGQIVSNAAADGYTLLYYGGVFWTASLIQSTPYDPVRDFSAITLVASTPNILVVNPLLPVSSVKELIALARAKPGELNYSTGGTGGASHLAGELFKYMAGVNLVRIPYNSNALQMADLISGQVQLAFAVAAAVTPHTKSGRLRAVAVTSAQPSALAPGLPTVAASGLPGYESGQLYGMFAPAKTPTTIIRLLNQEVVGVLNQPATKSQMFSAGAEVIGSPPEQLAAAVKSDLARLGKVIKSAGIQAH